MNGTRRPPKKKTGQKAHRNAKKFFLLTYYQSPRDLHLRQTDDERPKWQIGTRPMESQLHKIRDGLASGLLISFLNGLGYKYGGPILNLPNSVHEQLKGLGQIKDIGITACDSDLYLLVTRPPLNDFEDGKPTSKRVILPSLTDIEKNVFEQLRAFFSDCSRQHVNLSSDVLLPPDREGLRGVTFKLSGGAHAKALDHKHTVAYMLSTGSDGRLRGRKLVAVFGIGGTETLWLAYLIRKDPRFSRAFRDLLRRAEPSIALAIFKVPQDVPYPCLSYDLAALDAQVIPACLKPTPTPSPTHRSTAASSRNRPAG
jgi:hypothetical protein